MRWLLAFLLFALLADAPGLARADGAFPDELQVFAPPTLPHELVVGTNYGLLQSSDDGQTWSWLCEPAVSNQLVNAYGVAADGQLYALSGTGLSRSSDRGCTWSATTVAPGVRDVSDLFASPTDANRALAIAFDGAQFGLYGTTDRGATWTGPSLTGTLFGVELAHADGTRAYASAYQPSDSAHAVVYRSDDSGQHWTTLPHAELGDVYMFIAAVDPSDAGTVWFRLVSASGTGGDALAVTHDSGATVTVMLQAPGMLSALAVGADHTVWAADRANHLWRLDSGASAFTQLAGPAVRCLAERAGVLYACGDAQTDGFVLGASADRGATFQPLVTTTGYQTLACAAAARTCPTVNGVDAGSPAPDAGTALPPAPSPGCGCASTPELGLAALLALFAFAGRYRSTRTRK